MRITRLAGALVAAATLATGGCGGAGGGEGIGAGAEIAPASSAVFLAVANDPEGEQWQTAEELVARFPSGRDAVAEFLDGLEEEGLDFERDVRPALGPEVDVVVLDLEGAEHGEATVVLTQPPDEAKLEALVEKGDDVAYEMIDGWAVIAERADAIAEFEAARGDESLAETDAWSDATDDLPEDALVRGFVSGAALTRAAAAEGGGAGTAFLPGGGVPSLGFAVRAEDEGVRFDAAMRTQEDVTDPYEASLPAELPAGALAYVSWNDVAGAARQRLRQAGDENPQFDRYVAQAELALGLSLERDVLPLLEGEGGLAVYANGDGGGTTVPGVVVALAVEDDERALATVDRVVERASEFLGSVERVEDTEIAGIAVRTVSLEGAELLYAAFEGKLVFANARGPLDAMLGDGGALADDAAFTDAREAADAPDETTGFVYANVDALVAELAGEAPADVRRNLEPLGPLFVHASGDEDETSVQGFLGIE